MIKIPRELVQLADEMAQKAVKKWGLESQLELLEEECLELALAIQHSKRKLKQAVPGSINIDNIIGEAVDVEVMLEQFKYILTNELFISLRVFDGIKREKLNKLKERLEGI